MMSELSSAAQAVLIAEAKSRCLREDRGCHPDDSDWNGCYVCVHRRGLAAALRALLQEKGAQIYDEFNYRLVPVVMQNDIRAIADDLDSTNLSESD